jgi:hypothetical protein
MKKNRRMVMKNLCLHGVHLVLSFTETTNEMRDIIRIQ